MMKIAVVVLAAGAATRMQSIKQLLPYEDSTLIENALKNGLESNAFVTVCVLGSNAEIIQKSISLNPFFVTINENWMSGLGSSIAHSVRFAEQHFNDIEGLLFTLADQPFVTSKYLNTIIEKASNPEKIYASQYNHACGVPVLFPKMYFQDLKKLNGEQGAKKLLQFYQNQVIPITPDFKNIDIDTPEDYKKLQ